MFVRAIEGSGIQLFEMNYEVPCFDTINHEVIFPGNRIVPVIGKTVPLPVDGSRFDLFDMKSGKVLIK